MAIRPLYDGSGNPKTPTIVLCHRNKDRMGTIYPIESFEITPDLYQLNELSFTVHKKADGIELPLWNDIKDLRIIYIPEYDEYFEIEIDKTVNDDTTKFVTGRNLGVSELSQTMLYELEINTDDDIARSDYVVAKLYDKDDVGNSLLGRVLSKAPHYSIAHADDTISGLIRQFSIDGTSIYDFLTGDLADEIDCLVLINSVNRTVSLYDLEDTCLDCGTRQEFMNGVCPECGSTNIKEGYGDDTSIYVSIDNLSPEIQIETNKDEIKNTFRVLGGDDVMNAAVIACNPNGTAYINNFSDDMKEDMSEELREKLEEYDVLYTSYTDEYKEIMTNIYDVIDQILYLTSGMVPKTDISIQTDAATELTKLTSDNIGYIAVQNLKYAGNTTTDNAVKAYAQILLSSGFSLSIDSSTYSDGVWKGKFTVKNNSDDEDTATNEKDVTLTITDDYVTFISQKMEKLLDKSDMTNDDIDYTLYCLNSLTAFSDAYQSCLDILVEQGISDSSSEFYNDFYLKYYNKKLACDKEILVREGEISEQKVLQSEYETRRNEIQSTLNLESYIGTDLWTEYCSFRREDSYQNDNYISDGLSNAELLSKAQELFQTAQKEVIKASEITYTITSALGNLFYIKEFEPLRENFNIGNWIRLKADDKIYKIRLYSYTIKEDDISEIETVFSSATDIKSGVSDLREILESAKQMTTSYSSVKRQAKNSEDSKTLLNDWVSNGLQLTNMKIVQDVDNQSITWDSHGLLCREYSALSEEYDDRQLKIINKGLYVTDDNWQTARAGIGNFTIFNPESQQYEDHYGVIADTLVGKLVLSERVGIYNEMGSISLNENGLTITTDGREDNANNTVFTIQRTIVNDDEEEETERIMYVDDSGNLVLNGSMLIQNDSSTNTIGGMISDSINTLSEDVYDSLRITSEGIMSATESMINDYKTEIGQYLKFDENGLTIGSSSTSNFKTIIDNDSLRFVDGETTVAFINNTQLYIPNAVIQNTLSLGDFFISPRADGGVSVTWQGN